MQNRFPFLEQQTFSKAHIDTIGSTPTLSFDKLRINWLRVTTILKVLELS
jgi:hypothetical protein